MVLYPADVNLVTFKFESGTYAVPSGTSGLWIGLVTNHDLTKSENLTEIRYAGTNNRNFGQFTLGAEDFEGRLTFHPQNFRMFGFALGSIVDVSGTTSLHTISELNSDGQYYATSGTSNLTNFPSFTIVDSKKGQSDGQHFIRIVNGCVVDSYRIKATQGDPVECEVNYKGQAITIGSKASQLVNIFDTDATRPYVWSDAVFTLGGTTMNEITEISYTLDNTVENRHFVNGSRVPQAMVPTMRNHSIAITLPANSTWGTTLANYHKNGSVFNATLALTASATKNATWAFSGCEITDSSETTKAEGIDDFTVTIRPQAVSFAGSDAVRLYNPF